MRQAKKRGAAKRIAAAVIGILVIAAVIFFVKLDMGKEKSEVETVTRAAASKALALALTDQKTCLTALEQSRFSEAEKSNWYAKYMDYLYQNGYLTTELVPATAAAAGEPLTYAEYRYIAEKLGISTETPEGMKPAMDNEKVPKDVWWQTFDQWLTSLSENPVETSELTVYGTASNLKTIAPWTVYTDRGTYGFEGLSMDRYMDRTIRVQARDGEIFRVSEIVSEQVLYQNVWIEQSGGGFMSTFYDGYYRSFAVENLQDNYGGTLADIQMSEGQVQKVTLKKDSIKGKVLAVKETSIEIQGYGDVPIGDNFRVYKTYGELGMQSRDDILVGYDLQQFVVADGKICAALTTRALETSNIRVLIRNSDFSSIYHDSVTFTADVPFTLRYGEDKSETFAAETVIDLPKDSPYLQEGRLSIETESYAGNIRLMSVDRSYGTPSYRGTMEFTKAESGILIVNDLLLEDYLCRVVPSEMPVSYGLEALKAQAVCARSYAYKQIEENACREYGAHVDDSTTYQVYNNSQEQPLANEAVQATYGQIITHQGQPITAYYFSTSCGHTTDMSIWNGDPGAFPYIQGRLMADSPDAVDLTNEDNFRKFIDDQDYPAYDSTYAWFRWRVSLSLKELTDRINSGLGSYTDNNPDSVLVQKADGSFEQQKISSIGKISSMEVTQRGIGGVINELVVHGSEHTIKILKQSAVRNLLGDAQNIIKKKDGTEVTDKALLPSAYFYLSAWEDNKGYDLVGGGNGHGAGMSQNAAAGMALAGKNYEEMIQFFYKDVELTALY